MSTTALGVTLILTIGLVALTIAALADRRGRRRADGLLSDEDDPKADQAPPAYQTMTDLMRASPGRLQMSAAVLKQLERSTTVGLQLASQDFATHEGRRSVATDSRVLVCDEPVITVREILPIWGMLSPDQALTVVAPAFDREVLEVLTANLMAGTRLVQLLIGDAPARADIACATGAAPQPRSELQAGGVVLSELGHAALIVAGPDQTQVCAEPIR